MSEKLKPCPFCGNKAEFHEFYDGSIAAGCSKCGISTLHKFPSKEGEQAYAQLAKAWNRRAIIPETCSLTYIDLSEDFNTWECSKCENVWTFNDGTPEENHFYFCPRCGAKITAYVKPEVTE